MFLTSIYSFILHILHPKCEITIPKIYIEIAKEPTNTGKLGYHFFLNIIVVLYAETDSKIKNR